MRRFTGIILLLAAVAAGAASAQPVAKKAVKPQDLKTKDGSPKPKDPPKDPSFSKLVGGKSLADWKKEINHADASRRTTAIMAVLQYGEDAAECVPLLVGRLVDSDVGPRTQAIIALNMVGIEEKDTKAVVRALAVRCIPLNEPHASVRLEAGRTLARFIPQAGPAVQTLIEALENERSSWQVRQQLIGLLWRIAIATKDDSGRIHLALLPRTSGANEFTALVRLEAIIGLGAMPRPESPVVQAKVIAELVKISQYKNAHTMAIWGHVGLIAMQDDKPPDASLNALVKFIDGGASVDVRMNAIAALGALGKKAKTKKARLLDLLDDSEPMIVAAACTALGRVAEERDSEVVDGFLKVAGHKDPQRAAAGVVALVNFKTDVAKVIARFDKMRENKDLDINLRALIESGTKELQKEKK